MWKWPHKKKTTSRKELLSFFLSFLSLSPTAEQKGTYSCAISVFLCRHAISYPYTSVYVSICLSIAP